MWDGKEAFLYGSTSQCPQLGSGCSDYTPTFVSYSPGDRHGAADQPERHPRSQKQLKDMVPTAWTGSAVLFTDMSDAAAAVVTYTPATGVWSAGPPAPCAATPNAFGQVAWAGSILVAPCGRNSCSCTTLPCGRGRSSPRGRVR